MTDYIFCVVLHTTNLYYMKDTPLRTAHNPFFLRNESILHLFNVAYIRASQSVPFLEKKSMLKSYGYRTTLER